MWPVFKTKMLIHQSKVNANEKILFVKITHPFWSIIYVTLKFKFNAIVSFRNKILIQIACKSWTRMECGILVLKNAAYQHFPNF